MAATRKKITGARLAFGLSEALRHIQVKFGRRPAARHAITTPALYSSIFLLLRFVLFTRFAPVARAKSHLLLRALVVTLQCALDSGL